MNKIWPFSFYFWQFAGVAFMMPFVVLFYQGLGFNGGQIGLLTGLSPLISLVCTPLWTAWADAFHLHRLVLTGTLLGGTLMVITFPFFSTFLPILLVLIVYSILVSPVSPLSDSATLSMLGAERNLYGRLRLGGTIGFALAAPLAGMLVQGYGLKMAFWGCAVCYLLALISSQFFVHETGISAARQETPLRQGLRQLLGNPRFLVFLAGALVGGFALAISNNYFFPYMKELGADQTSMGIAMTLGVVCEVPVMFFGNRLIGRFKAYPLFILSLVMTGLRLLLFYLAVSPWQAMLIQLMAGLTFPAMWITGVSFVDENAPAGLRASAQGLFSALVFGVGTALGGFVGGALLESVGARAMCLWFGVATLLVTAAILLVGGWLPAARPGSASN